MATVHEHGWPLGRPVNPTGLWNWLTTVDHKKIGILYGLTAFFMFLTGGVEALLMRAQLAQADLDIVTPQVYNQLFTMHGTTMIFLAIMPLGTAFANFIVPLQIGARDVAFPRLNAFTFWTFAAGATVIRMSYFLAAMPDAGWFAYAPLTTEPFNPSHGMDYWTVGIFLTGIASIATALNFIITIINMRAPGMTMMRLPVFVWMSLVTQILTALALTVLSVALIELFLDRNYGTNFFDVSQGASPLLWQHLFWIFGHPEVYILILPSFGIISEVLPTFSRKPLFGYPAIVLAGIIIAFLGFMVWGHHMFTTGLGPIPNSVFAITTMIIAVPTGVKIFNWLGTLWGGAIRFDTPMLFALGFIALFTIGGISGVMHSVAPSDYQQQDTYFVVAHLHYVLVSGAIFALFAGLYYWFPKITGRMYNEGLGKAHFWLMFLGHNLTFFPMHFAGMFGMPRRIYTYPEIMGWEPYNLTSSIGAAILAISIGIFVFNALNSWWKGEQAVSDPWDGRTLEWSIPSPPPEYNFAEIPVVRDRDDWWSRKYRRIRRPIPVAGGLGNSEKPQIHMPQPSYWPLVVSIGLLIAGYGVIHNIVAAAIGAAIAIVSVYAWALEPVSEEGYEARHY